MARRKAAISEIPLPGPVNALSDNDRIARLEEAVNRQLDYILQNEVADLASRIRDIKAAMDMIRTIKSEDPAASGEGALEISFLE